MVLARARSTRPAAVEVAGSGAFLYVLFEHQSTVDPLMPLRLLRYMVRIWDHWLADHPGATRIPAVVPVVIHHGAHGWTGPRTMCGVLDLGEAMLAPIRAHVPDFQLLLDDLPGQSDEQLRARAMQALGVITLLLLKHARHAEDLLEKLVGWASMLQEVLSAPDGLAAMERVMRYIIQVSEFVTVRDIKAVLAPAVGEELREVVMTEGERLIQLGRCEAKAESVLTLLRQRSLTVAPEVEQRVRTCTDTALLDEWFRRAVVAERAEKIFEE